MRQKRGQRLIIRPIHLPQIDRFVSTTSAREALIRADQVQKGTHITAMGSDDHGKQELAVVCGRNIDLEVFKKIIA
jgi:ornithine cyclodeaminase/alanine dehydrogenase-like protein (mu-crystallin family)